MKPLLLDPSGNGNNTILGSFSSEHGGCAYSINNGGRIVGGRGNGEEGSAWLFDITGLENNLYLGQGEAAPTSDNGLIVVNNLPLAGEGWHVTFLLPSFYIKKVTIK
jgi:uncharacterized membrane protein